MGVEWHISNGRAGDEPSQGLSLGNAQMSLAQVTGSLGSMVKIVLEATGTLAVTNNRNPTHIYTTMKLTRSHDKFQGL